MSEFKPCPFCNADNLDELQDMHENYEAGYGRYMAGETLYNAGMTKTDAAYFAALHNALPGLLEVVRRAQPDNEPLTLEQLRHGDVVWLEDLVMGEVECLRFDRIEPATYHSGDDYRFEQFGTDTGIIRWACKYGINWLAYRRPPERSENE